MLTLSNKTPVHALVRQAVARTDYGSGVKLNDKAVIYPAIQASFMFDSVVVCRIEDTDLWVRHDELEGIRTLDALYILGRHLDDILIELLEANPYDFEVPEETEELSILH